MEPTRGPERENCPSGPQKRFEITDQAVVPPLSSEDQILTQLAGGHQQQEQRPQDQERLCIVQYIKLLAPKLGRGSPTDALHPLLGGKSLNLTPPASREVKDGSKAGSKVIAANRTHKEGTDAVSSAPDTIAVFDELLVGLPADAAKRS